MSMNISIRYWCRWCQIWCLTKFRCSILEPALLSENIQKKQRKIYLMHFGLISSLDSNEHLLLQNTSISDSDK
jgi:hypothetical protein